MKILVELEFNEDCLGPKWMNPDNLALLLYTGASTNQHLLKVVSFEEESPNKKLEMDCAHIWVPFTNEVVVSGVEVCTKCKEFRTTTQL